MSAIPGDIDASGGPPMTIPLRHFVVALAFLVAGIAVGAVGTRAGTVARVHLLLAGWVCLTIMGAMTQFVPVWSGVPLHSRRLASAQLPLAAVGFAGLATAFLLGADRMLPLAGATALAGVWLFVYNIGRTLAAVTAYDVTETHFAVALGWFLLVTLAGLVLASHRAVGTLPIAGVTYGALRDAHATLAVFGAVLTTVYGALYQLGTMFTQSELTALDRRLKRYELLAYPPGVALLALGRLLTVPWVATAGGALVATGTFSLGVVLARRLVGATTDWTPMLTRYSVVSVSLLSWAPLALVAWTRAPLAGAHRFGADGTALLLLGGGIGFVVLGTLYHVVPFIIWVHCYSDRLGFEDVPLIDDLYDGRVAAADGLCFLAAGASGLLAGLAVGPEGVGLAAGVLAGTGAVLFAGNLLGVVAKHSDRSIGALIMGVSRPRDDV
jgi:hypothetical protein